MFGWGVVLFFNRAFLASTFAKRDRVTIILDILESLRDKHKGKRKTNIMQSANLSTYQVRKYLELLYINGLVKKYGDAYQVTHKGLEFMRTFEQLNLKLK
jgi:predicted transcriptional regulator